MGIIEESTEASYGNARLIFYPLLITATVLWMFHRWQQQSRLVKLGNKLPGPSAWPLFGNALLAVGKTPSGIFSCYLEQIGFFITQANDSTTWC